jgi:hypothetical protein
MRQTGAATAENSLHLCDNHYFVRSVEQKRDFRAIFAKFVAVHCQTEMNS